MPYTFYICIFSYRILGTADLYCVNVIDALLTFHWTCLSTNIAAAFVILISPESKIQTGSFSFSDAALPNSKLVNYITCSPFWPCTKFLFKINIYSKFQNSDLLNIFSVYPKNVFYLLFMIYFISVISVCDLVLFRHRVGGMRVCTGPLFSVLLFSWIHAHAFNCPRVNTKIC